MYIYNKWMNKNKCFASKMAYIMKCIKLTDPRTKPPSATALPVISRTLCPLFCSEFARFPDLYIIISKWNIIMIFHNNIPPERLPLSLSSITSRSFAQSLLGLNSVFG